MNVAVLDSFPPELESVAAASPRATFYHTDLWLRALATAYPRMALRCLVARDGGDIVGYLPFFTVRRGPFRASWSLPFGTYGGPVSAAGDAVDRELVRAFRNRLGEAGTLEVGWVDFGDVADDGGEVEACETHVVDLSPGFDTVWRERFDKPRRRRVRRAEEQGVLIRRAGSGDDVHRFFEVYRARLRGWESDAGHPEVLFRELVARGTDDRVRLYLALHEGEVVGGHLNFYYKESVIAWYGMASTRGDDLHAGTLLYATAMREACEGGFTSFNLGASLGKESLIEYKQSLGGVARRYRIVRYRRLAGRVVAALRNLRSGR